MGRRTWESIGRPLPGRISIVVTRQVEWWPDGALTAGSLDDAIALVATTDSQKDEVFIIGGGELYRAALPCADRFYRTRVHANIAGDTTFPEVDWSAWRLVEQSRHEADEKNDFPHTFEVWDRL